MRLNLDKKGKFRYQVLSMRKDTGANVELESSADSLGLIQGWFERQYSKWGFEDTNYYLIDWQEQKVLAKHETFTNE